MISEYTADSLAESVAINHAIRLAITNTTFWVWSSLEGLVVSFDEKGHYLLNVKKAPTDLYAQTPARITHTYAAIIMGCERVTPVKNVFTRKDGLLQYRPGSVSIVRSPGLKGVNVSVEKIENLYRVITYA